MDEALSREGGTKLGKVASIHHAIPLKVAMRKKRLQIKCLVALSMGAQPPEQEQSPCPGCDSTSTKYSYVYDYGSGYCRRFGFYFCSTAFDLLQPTEIEILKMAPGSVRKLKTKPYKSQQSVLNNASKHASMDSVTLNGVKSHFHQINAASTAGKSNSLSETQNGSSKGSGHYIANQTFGSDHMSQSPQVPPTRSIEVPSTQSCEVLSTQNLQDPSTETGFVRETSSKKKGRGQTMGKGLMKAFVASGNKMKINVDPLIGRPINGQESAKLSSQIGVVSRDVLPVPKRWTDIDEQNGLDPVFDHMNIHMDVNIDDLGVRDCLIDRLKCSSRQKCYKLHMHYKKFATLEEAKNNKPSFCPDKKNWETLCEYFATPKFKHTSTVNGQNRKKVKAPHISGRTPFTVRRHEIYTGCIVNGVRFLSKERDNRRKSQNSGIVVEGNHGDDMIEFYGVLNDIIQLDYVKDRHVTIFKCDWFDLGKRNSGIQKEGNIVSVKVTGKWYENDSYILADQARQVFYINDPKLGSEWRVVIPFQHRHIYDVDEMQDEAMDVDDDSLLEDGVYQENDIDGTFAFQVGDGDDEIQSLNREDIDLDEIESLTVSRLPQVEEVENSEDVDEEDEIDDTMVDYCSSEENFEQNSDFDMGSDDDY
ncbi:hypothetical protein DITRI_Ditri19aG0130800 [Diplodiscus trichospermus]